MKDIEEKSFFSSFLFPLQQKGRQHFYPFTETLWRKLPFTSPFPAPALSGSVRFWKAGIHWVAYSLLIGGLLLPQKQKNKIDSPAFFFLISCHNSCLDLYKDHGSAYLAHYFQLISKAGKPSFISALCTSCPDSGWLCSLVLSWGPKLFSFRVM